MISRTWLESVFRTICMKAGLVTFVGESNKMSRTRQESMNQILWTHFLLIPNLYVSHQFCRSKLHLRTKIFINSIEKQNNRIHSNYYIIIHFINYTSRTASVKWLNENFLKTLILLMFGLNILSVLI